MITYCLQKYDFFLIPPKMPCRNVLVTSVTATTVTTSGTYYFSDLSILTPIISRI